MYAHRQRTSRSHKEVVMKVKNPQRIRKARTDAGYSQRNLAALCGCSQAAISLIERGTTRTVSKALAESLCKWLKRPSSELFTETTDAASVQSVTTAAGSKRQEVAA